MGEAPLLAMKSIIIDYTSREIRRTDERVKVEFGRD